MKGNTKNPNNVRDHYSQEEKEIEFILENFFCFAQEEKEIYQEFKKLLDWKEGEAKSLEETVQFFAKYPEFPIRIYKIAQNKNIFRNQDTEEHIEAMNDSNIQFKYYEFKEKYTGLVSKIKKWFGKSKEGHIFELKRKPPVLTRIKDILEEVPYVGIPWLVKDIKDWGHLEKIEEDVDEKTKEVVRVDPKVLKIHMGYFFLTCVVSVIVAILATVVIQSFGYNDWFFIFVFLPWILLPGSIYGILYCISYVDFTEIVYKWHHKSNILKLILAGILFGVSISIVGVGIGIANLFLGLLFWEGITFFTFAEKYYGIDDESIEDQTYKGVLDLIKKIYDVPDRFRGVIDELGGILLSLLSVTIMFLLFFWLLPINPMFEAWGFQQFSIPTFGADLCEIMFPANPSVGKQLQILTIAACILGLLFFTWKPHRTLKLTKVTLMYMIFAVIPLSIFVGMCTGNANNGAETSQMNILVFFFAILQAAYLILVNLNTITRSVDINLNSNQLKKSWLRFNFAIKNREYYVVILFFMFMSGIAGYFTFSLASGEFFPLATEFRPFGIDWIPMIQIFQYVGSNIVFIAGMIYMWIFYRQGMSFKRVPFLRGVLNWKHRNEEDEKWDIWTPSFLNYDPVPSESIKNLKENNQSKSF